MILMENKHLDLGNFAHVMFSPGKLENSGVKVEEIVIVVLKQVGAFVTWIVVMPIDKTVFEEMHVCIRIGDSTTV